MSRCPTRRPRPIRTGAGADTSIGTDTLAGVARIVDEAAQQRGWRSSPSLVRVVDPHPDRGRDRFLEIGCLLLDEAVDRLGRPVESLAGQHPVDVLLGFEAPPSWRALGVVAEGTVLGEHDPPGRIGHHDGGRVDRGERATDGAGARPGGRPGVRVVHVVGRDGASASVLRVQGREPEHHEARGLHDAPDGRVDDVLRRALGLPTAPPEEPTVALWALMWLDRLRADRAVADARSAPLDWTAAARAFPSVESAFTEGGGVAPVPSPEGMARFGAMRGRAESWGSLRRACAQGIGPVPGVDAGVDAGVEVGVDAGLAAWMDDGIFSRWATGSFPHLAELFGAVADLVPPGTAAAVAEVLAAWGLDPSPRDPSPQARFCD